MIGTAATDEQVIATPAHQHLIPAATGQAVITGSAVNEVRASAPPLRLSLPSPPLSRSLPLPPAPKMASPRATAASFQASEPFCNPTGTTRFRLYVYNSAQNNNGHGVFVDLVRFRGLYCTEVPPPPRSAWAKKAIRTVTT